MIESMQQRSSPVNAHKVATQYFDHFRQERHILDEASGKEADKKPPTAVNTVLSTAVTTAVDSTVKSTGRKKAAKTSVTMVDSKVLSDVLAPSEFKIYAAMREESINKVSNELRFGLKYLKEKTSLSDKTVRVAIHSLEE